LSISWTLTKFSEGIIVVFVKLSTLIQYLNIFAPVKQINRLIFYDAWTLTIFYAVFCAICTIPTIWACSRREKTWNPFVTTGHCIPYIRVVRASASFNIFSDVTILVLPGLVYLVAASAPGEEDRRPFASRDGFAV
jgi:hypothetical protein